MATVSVPHDSSGVEYPFVSPHEISRIEIFPPIGIARVGDSGDDTASGPIEYYYAPEVPGLTQPPLNSTDSFRDRHQKIKRQAVRFRVYAYDSAGKILGEINSSHDYQLTWTVHVANKKAAYYKFSGLHRKLKAALRNPDTHPVDIKEQDYEEPYLKTPQRSAFDQRLEYRKNLIIDPGPQTLEPGAKPVKLQSKFFGSIVGGDGADVVLGELRADSLGRLVFLGGSGKAHCINAKGKLEQRGIISEFDSIDWFDDICDGWVTVRVAHRSRPNMDAEITRPREATVTTAPPKYAWGMRSPITLYDILENRYKESYQEHAGTNFYKDIWPVLMTAYTTSWVNTKTFQGHGPGSFGDYQRLEKELSSAEPEARILRERIFDRLRKPDGEDKAQASARFMPRLSGDDGDALEPGSLPGQLPKEHTIPLGRPTGRFSALTRLQYNRFEMWKEGKFELGEPLGTKTRLEDYKLEEQPVMLTRAALEEAIGEPIYPGLEMSWIAKLDETWDTASIPAGMRPPFRVDHTRVWPGFLTRGLSLPWQSDFDLCATHWWPSTRPDDIITKEIAIKALKEMGPNDKVAEKLSKLPRKEWSRGLRKTTDVQSSFFPGSTDMVKMWNQLGFVALMSSTNLPGPSTQPGVWVEQDRTAPEVED